MTHGYGVDLASRRLDTLDRQVLSRVSNYTSRGQIPHVLEIGAGAAGLTKTLLSAGACVTVVDPYIEITHYRNLFEIYEQQLTLQTVSVETFVTCLNTASLFSIVCAQRTLHYLPATVLRSVLAVLRTHTSVLYLSVTGVESAIGERHPAKNEPVVERFAPLALTDQEIFSISAPLCPYRQSEIRTLVEEAGYIVTSISTSAFGNHRIVANACV